MLPDLQHAVCAISAEGGVSVVGPLLRQVMVHSAHDIYWNAVRASRLEQDRQVRLFVAGKIDVCPCGMDMERDAIIKAFDEILHEANQENPK
jgi:hypothetical protein